MPGSPRIPRKEFAAGVRRVTAFAVATLSVCALFAADPAPPGRATINRLLAPLSDLMPGQGLPVPPAPSREDLPATDVGRAEISSSAKASSRFAYTWFEGDEEVTLLRGRCVVLDAGTTLLADEVVLWRVPTASGHKLLAYLEGNARLEEAGKSEAAPSMIVDLPANRVDVQNVEEILAQSQSQDAVYQRAVERRAATGAAETRVTARPPMEGPVLGDPGVGYETVQLRAPEGRLRRIRIFQRSTVPFNVDSVRSTQTIPPEQVTVITGGVNVLIDGVDDQLGLVDLSADRVVIWTQSSGESFETERVQTEDTPFTVYLEGNIIIRQGNGPSAKTVFAERAVYDARAERALMEHAELRAFVPEIGTDLRVRASQMRQLSKGHYYAADAWTTTSEFGKPGYRLQSRELFVEPRYDVNLQWLGAGTEVVDPLTGMEMVETNWVRSYQNTVFVEDVPVLYSPYLAGPAEEIKIPLTQASAGNDRVFGFRVKTAWDPFDLFGIEQPQGVELNLLADYFSERGPGGGLSGSYGGSDLFGAGDQFRGTGIGYYVNDRGSDRLGQFRNNIEPTTEDRWRLKWRHRHNFPANAHINAELGILSDHNFLEQYFEPEFDNDKDQENLLYATQNFDPWGFGNWSYEILGQAPINDFETVTGWYPKVDLWGLSEPLFDGRLTWSSHTLAGYGDINPADPGDYANEAFFNPLPYAPDVEGANFMTRHQLDLPLPIGPLNIVPFAMGEAAVWEEGMDGSDLSRLTSSVGVRSSIQFQRVFPNVSSRVLGLNGLAHKIRLEGEYRITDTTEPLGSVAQYTEIDDNAQERLRNRFIHAYYGGVVPPEVDPRFYGVRAQTGTALGSPYYELVEDQQVVRLAMRQRLQTKTGPPGFMRIRDWMTLDTGVSLFPNADRDNFGETAGLAYGNYGWYLSERTQLLLDAQYDFFEGAPRLWSVGFNTQRSRRGNLYLGLRHLEFATQGESDILVGSYSYLMSPKWISTLTAFVDVKNTFNTGESATLTRIGSDFLVHLGVQRNNTIDNYGFTISIEPRLGNLGGANTMRLSSLLTPTINP